MSFINTLQNMFKSGNDFGSLDKIISSSQSKEIILENDITLSGNDEKNYIDGIKINQNGITIDGQGHSIDAMNKIRIFDINAENVVIKNLRLTNGYNRTKGGAIYNRVYSKVSFINCDFINNLSNDGGAIFNENNGQINIKTSNLICNNAENGGAIVNKGNMEIEESIFKRNVVRNMKKEEVLQLDMAGGNFYKNPAFGGAIDNYAKSKIILNNCRFISNKAVTGGAIRSFLKNDVTVNDCFFNNNDPDDFSYQEDGYSNEFLGIG